MDNFTEQLVRKKPDAIDIMLRALIILLGTLVIAGSIFVALFYFPLMLMAGLGAVYLISYFLKKTFVEYEYIITNNEIDIDKIMGRSKRKRLITIDLRTVESLAPFSEQNDEKISTTVFASNGTTQNLWKMVANHQKYGRIAMFFSPDLKTLSHINLSLPNSIKLKLPKEEEENNDV